MQGRVKWFSDEKGYGFIKAEDGTEVFVHQSKIGGTGHRTLTQNELVEFDVVESAKGKAAANVVRLNPP